ncbi:MAG: hypothetical protein V4722_19385 [Bacteroidota bacterium]
MDSNILQVDISKIDKEMEEISSKIAIHQERLAKLTEFRSYINAIVCSGPTDTEVKPIVEQGVNSGVSDFILSMLANGRKCHTKDIIQSYANYVGQGYDKVSGNVSNALSRIKTAGKIDNQVSEGGRKQGSLWFLKYQTTMLLDTQ